MKTITYDYKQELKKLGREIDLKFFLHTNDKIITEDGKFLITQNNRHLVVEQFDEIEVDETITSADIYNAQIITNGSLLSTMMKEIDFELKEDLRIGDVIGCQFGLKVNGSYEYIDFGNYMVFSKEFNEDTKTYSYVAYDRMLLTMQETSQEFLSNLDNQTLAYAIHTICDTVGLNYTASQEELTAYPNLSKTINEGTFTDMQITYRDILDMICQALGLSMIVDGKDLKLKTPQESSCFEPYEIKGNTIQDGTPTPSEPIEIKTVTGEITHNNKTIDLGDIELCKIGTYQDKIYKNNGSWYIHKEIGKVVLNGTENITITNSGTANWYYKITANNPTANQLQELCSHYPNAGIYNSNTTQGILLITNGTEIRIRYGTQDTADNFKTWLSNNNVTLYYPLATTTNTVITDTNLIAQLENAGTITGDIDERYLKDTNVSFGEKYMINSVVLSRSEDNDTIYRRDEQSIAENGVHEFKIKDNLIMLYDDREDYIDEIFEQLNGLEYYINDYSSIGITYLDWLDFYNVTVDGKTYKCLMLNDEIKINQGLEESVYTEEPEETVTNYKTSSKTDKEVSFIVDKQNGSIRAKVNKGEVINEINLDESGAEINAEKISLAGKEIKLTTDDITISSTNFNVDSGGNITANNVTLNSGTFKGDVNTSQNCYVGNDLYVGQNQSSTTVDSKFINFSGMCHLGRWYAYGEETLQARTGNTFEVQYNNGLGENFNLFQAKPDFTLINNRYTDIMMGDTYINLSVQPTIGSDERLKQEIKDINTSWIDELKVKEFEYKKIPNKKQIGLIAQDYLDKEYGKYFLNENQEGYYSIAYGNITNALIQYCQEMKKEINSLKEEIKQLKESDK